MTAAQKQNIARFKAVQAEAKKLKAKNKKLTHQEAVKQAWAIMYSKKKSGKKVGYSSDRLKVVKKATPYIKKYKAKGWSKADAIRNANIDAAFMSGTKKKAERKPSEKDILKKVHSAKTSSKTLYNKLDKLDEAQHKHMGALDKNILQKYQHILDNIKNLEIALIKNKETQKKAPYKTDFWKKYFKEKNTKIRKYIAELKKHKAELKKLL